MRTEADDFVFAGWRERDSRYKCTSRGIEPGSLALNPTARNGPDALLRLMLIRVPLYTLLQPALDLK